MNKTDVVIRIIQFSVILLILGVIIFNVWACCTYGNKNITEVPMWVLWFTSTKGR